MLFFLHQLKKPNHQTAPYVTFGVVRAFQKADRNVNEKDWFPNMFPGIQTHDTGLQPRSHETVLAFPWLPAGREKELQSLTASSLMNDNITRDT